MLYVVDKTTSEIVKAAGKPERSVPHSGSEGDREITVRVLRHNRTVDAVQAQMRSKAWCLHPLGITRWGEHNGALWHKQGRKAQ